MFCVIVCHVGEAFFPNEVKLVFLDEILYPVKTHVGGFWEFLAHG